MTDHYVSYECAQALKRLGFAEETTHYYINFKSDGKIKLWSCNPPDNHNARLSTNKVCSAPRLDQAAAWLRDCKGIDVEVSCIIHNLSIREYKVCLCYFRNDLVEYKLVSHGIHSYEFALSAGISAALKILEEKK